MADLEHLHLAAFGVGEGDLAVGTVHLQKLQGDVFLKFLRRDELAEFERDVVEPGVKDFYLFDKFANRRNQTAGVAFESFGRQAGGGIGDEKLVLGVVVEDGLRRKAVSSAHRAFAHENRAVLHPFAQGWVGGDVEASEVWCGELTAAFGAYHRLVLKIKLIS